MNSLEFKELTGFTVTEYAAHIGHNVSSVRGRLSRGKCKIPIENSHGKDHPLYGIWSGIKSRCYDTEYHRYPYYGLRGIRMSGEWFYSFDKFVEDIGKRPSPQHSVDRVDPTKDYSKDNCRWATKREQGFNKITTSEDSNIIFSNNRYYVKFEIQSKPTYLDVFFSIEEAREFRDEVKYQLLNEEF